MENEEYDDSPKTKKFTVRRKIMVNEFGLEEDQ